MQKIYKPARMAIVFIIMAALLTVYVSSLYKMQIYDAQPVAEEEYPQSRTKRVETLAAARGGIYDRNGIRLVTNRSTYNISLSRSALLKAPDTNGTILSLIYAAAEFGIKYTDTFPITIGAPFDYLSGMDSAQRTRLDKYFEYYKLDPEISASDLFVWLKNNYDIDYKTGISDARLIIGIRYELETRVIPGINTSAYVFAKDVGAEFASYVREMGYPGVYVEQSSVRDYHTEYAAHLLGYIGSIGKDDVEKYLELGYPRDALVGQTGVELAFEEYLHGTAGSRTVYTSDTGAVLDITGVTEPVPGNDVYLTIDIKLQAAVEDALREYIDEINLERDEESLVTGGSVVVTDVNTGELLASASYPTFDPATVKQNIGTLSADTVYNPLLNRATNGKYNPGSTYKMVTAFAGLQAGAIGRWTQINDTGRFTKLAHHNFQPVCWIYPNTGHGHGLLDVVGALENSCNVFFYELGYEIGPTAIANAAAVFGLGQKTGLHVSEAKGTVASPEYKQSVLGEGWWDAETPLAAIGQSYNLFTPVQLATYTATIANGGTLYSLSELSKVKSADYTKLIYEHTPTVVSRIGGESSGYLQIIQEGMRSAAKTGTAKDAFASYNIPVAAKTGTVQSDTSKIDNGVFVCYAPYNEPEIAISVVIERGKSGSQIMGIARSVLDFYFEDEQNAPVIPDGELIP